MLFVCSVKNKREKESKKAMVRELEADNAKAVEKLQRLSASRAHTEAAVLQEEVGDRIQQGRKS